MDVFSYFDYRKILKELYQEKKFKDKQFNYRKLAELAGFSSPGFFTNILSGKRNISDKTAERLAAVFCLTPPEREYFLYLVHADQAKNHSRRKHFFDRAVALKQSHFNLKQVESYQFYDHWYYTAVRELIAVKPFKDNYRELARSVYPNITISQARDAVRVLEELQMIQRNATGYFEQADPYITSVGKITAAHLSQYHMETSMLAEQAMDKCNKDIRNISTLTLGISEDGYQEIIKRIRAFRKDLLELAQQEKKKDRVYHMNFHLFPMSKIKKPNPLKRTQTGKPRNQSKTEKS